jgi:hypothetical protein
VHLARQNVGQRRVRIRNEEDLQTIDPGRPSAGVA